MKKAVSFISSVIMFITVFLPLTASAAGTDEIYYYEDIYGEKIYYYQDSAGEKYIIEDGRKVLIAVPVSVELITDEQELSELNQAVLQAKQARSVSASNLPISTTMNFSSTIATTSILRVTKNYIFLKCSDLNPSGAKRGFSYYIRYSPDGSTWYRALYVNQSLLFYTKHRWAELGNSPYIQIQMWSYYGTVSSCTLNIRESALL